MRADSRWIVWAASMVAMGCQPAPALEERAQGRVTLGVIHHAADRSADRNTPIGSIERADGLLRLGVLAIVIAEIELHTCAFAPPAEAGLWFVPEARAHVPSSATRLGAPFVEDLLGRPDRAQIFGEIAPPVPHDYCHLWAIVAPADEDVVNTTQDVDTQTIVGHSAIVEGAWRATREAPWQPFSYTLDMRARYPVTLSKGGQKKAALTEREQSAFWLIDKTIDARLLEQLDPSSMASVEGAETLIARVGEQLTLYKTD